tara:strand:+ start:12597 stop:12944 length:348 start_codon:yes stop_codon:yes gene_type:complete
MSLKNQLTQKGSNLTKYNGTNPTTNIGATKQSVLHADGGNETYGYSTSGDYFQQVNDSSNAYDNGSPKTLPLPQPSLLDMAGGAKINAPQYNHKQAYDWRQGQQYDDKGPVDGRY